MEFAKGIDFSEDAPSVPEKIRQFVYKHHMGLMSLVINEETQPGRFKRLNKITLENKPGEFPNEDALEITEGIMRVLWARDQEREEHDPPITFQIMGDKKIKKDEHSRPSIKYTYVPEGSPDDFIDDSFESHRDSLIEQQREQISQLFYHLDTSLQHIKDISNNNNQALKPLMDALGWMGQFYAAGLQNQQAALALIFDMKKAEAEERGRTERMKESLKIIKKPLIILAQQASAFAAKKMGMNIPTVDDDDEDNESAEVTDVENDEVVVSSNTHAHDVENVEDSLTDHQKENPIATFANAAAMTLETDQWFEIASKLKKKEITLFKALVQAKTDQDCAQAYDAFIEQMPATKLLALNNILNEEQKQMIAQLGELVEAAKENWENAEA